MNMDNYYKCVKCGTVYPFNKEILTCTKHGPYYGYLTLMYDYGNVDISKNNFGWGKYLDLLPCDSFKINFNEQKTPLLKIENFGKKYGFDSLFVKDESKNPTGSFKDKESICLVNKAVEWGVDKIFVVSSGNAAVSTAAYAQKAKIQCECLIPSTTSVGKRILIGFYGGKLVEKKGNYEEIYKWAIDSNYDGWNATPGVNPVKEEGIKIIGFEIWEEIGVPDVIVVPCGNGTLLYGIYKAFMELQFLGLITKLPKLIGVQIKGAAPLKAAFESSKEFVGLSNIPDSIAEGIVARESYSSPKVMMALKDTSGEVVEVDDVETVVAMKEIMNEESLIPEPTSAVVYAAIKKMQIDIDLKIVLIQTAGGMKNLKEIMESFVNSSLKT